MRHNLLITAILWHISNKNKINQTIKIMYKIVFRLACEDSDSEVYENGKLQIFPTEDDARKFAQKNLNSKFVVFWSVVKI
jgi:hypothetical protein